MQIKRAKKESEREQKQQQQQPNNTTATTAAVATDTTVTGAAEPPDLSSYEVGLPEGWQAMWDAESGTSIRFLRTFC